MNFNKIISLSIVLFLLTSSMSLGQTMPLFDAPVFDPVNNLVDPNTNLPTGLIEQISVDIVPKVPAPGETVRISVQSYSTNFDKANFVWRANGEIFLQGRGERNVVFTAPESGSSVTISVLITKEEGGTINRSYTFSPSDVDIMYEAETYTHPYYKGKALYTSEANIRFIAMPEFKTSNGQVIDPSNLSYTWSVNGKVFQDFSGFGKRVFEVKSNLINRATEITVEVSAVNSKLKAKNSIFITGKEPDLVLYENNPLLGVVFEKAIEGNFILRRPEIQLQSVPYFYSTNKKDNDFVDYVWRMNGNDIEAGSRMSSITLRNETGEAGRSLISLQAEHLNNILQIATKSIELNFEKHDSVFDETFEF